MPGPGPWISQACSFPSVVPFEGNVNTKRGPTAPAIHLDTPAPCQGLESCSGEPSLHRTVGSPPPRWTGGDGGMMDAFHSTVGPSNHPSW